MHWTQRPETDETTRVIARAQTDKVEEDTAVSERGCEVQEGRGQEATEPLHKGDQVRSGHTIMRCNLAAIVALDHEAAIADVAAATGEVGLDVEDAQHLEL